MLSMKILGEVIWPALSQFHYHLFLGVTSSCRCGVHDVVPEWGMSDLMYGKSTIILRKSLKRILTTIKLMMLASVG